MFHNQCIDCLAKTIMWQGRKEMKEKKEKGGGCEREGERRDKKRSRRGERERAVELINIVF